MQLPNPGFNPLADLGEYEGLMCKDNQDLYKYMKKKQKKDGVIKTESSYTTKSGKDSSQKNSSNYQSSKTKLSKESRKSRKDTVRNADKVKQKNWDTLGEKEKSTDGRITGKFANLESGRKSRSRKRSLSKE